MLNQEKVELIDLPADSPPLLLVVIDTEEEFDWSQPHSRSNTAVNSVAAQHRAQDIFDRYGVVPTYVVDYPVATSEVARDVLGRFLKGGRCEIGAHLHPWVNPPHEEPVNAYNSYAGNLPPALERAKLECLTETIAESFGVRPTVYRAGRFGAGPATARSLEDLGYDVDVSVVPHTSFAADGGPDFRLLGLSPYWFGESRRLLEIPLSCGFCGLFRAWGPVLHHSLVSPPGMKMRAPGVAARMGLLERICLSPEGIDHVAHRRLTRSLLDQGCRIFSLTYHSPSLEPGNTPYVRDEADLRELLDSISRYLNFFFDELGGRPTTAHECFRLFASRTSSEQPARMVAE